MVRLGHIRLVINFANVHFPIGKCPVEQTSHLSNFQLANVLFSKKSSPFKTFLTSFGSIKDFSPAGVIADPCDLLKNVTEVLPEWEYLFGRVHSGGWQENLALKLATLKTSHHCPCHLVIRHSKIRVVILAHHIQPICGACQLDPCKVSFVKGSKD